MTAGTRSVRVSDPVSASWALSDDSPDAIRAMTFLSCASFFGTFSFRIF